MSKDINIVDIIVHLHPENSCDDTDKIEQELRDRDGVVSVHFNAEAHPHAVVVAYNPDAVTSQQLLAGIRQCDKAAMMAGL
ncbi:MAG: hypothetical protein GXP22_11835 [Gammaproteobacteria bacterium]|nr:hypothetical protein [Gammaproteobacteria bacterium]